MKYIWISFKTIPSIIALDFISGLLHKASQWHHRVESESLTQQRHCCYHLVSVQCPGRQDFDWNFHP